MNQEAWKKLHDWLTRVFGIEEGEELFAAHVAEAREANLELPA